MKIKAVKFDYESGAEIYSLLETFRQMCNDAMRVALAKKPKNRFELIELSYQRLKECGLSFVRRATRYGIGTYWLASTSWPHLWFVRRGHPRLAMRRNLKGRRQ